MQVVINIPDNQYAVIYNKIKSGRDEIARKGYANNDLVPAGWVAIADGIVLPKGHGDLIERDVTALPPEEIISRMIIANAEVVIPADKENEE